MDSTAILSLFAGFLGGIVTSHFMNRNRTIKAKELHIVDDLGRTRVKLGFAEGRPFVGIFDKSERVRGGMFLNKHDDFGISFVDEEARIRMLLELLGDEPGITIKDKSGHSRVGIGLEQDDEEPELALIDSLGEVLNKTDPFGLAMPYLYITDQDGELVWGI